MHYGFHPRSGSGRHTGEVLGYNVSFRFLGNVIGPVLGGMISSHFGISSAFYVTAFLFFSGACLLLFQRSQAKKQKPKQADIA
ncbi:MFS transporter [Bacillus sonorensis]|nr:MFS transporter [Bacillus sonorensis]